MRRPTTILVIDDEDIVRSLICEMLELAGHTVIPAETPQRALELLVDPRIRLVISDIVMPGLTGFELLEEMRSARPSLPVLLVTGAGTEENLTEALARGAAGLIPKPFTQREIVDAVDAVLQRAAASEQEVRHRALAPTLTSALANAIEVRDSITGGHTERLADIAVKLAGCLGLPDDELESVRLGALLHDVGKIGIPDSILLKEGPLEPSELELMRRHTLIGDWMLEPLDALSAARPAVRHHHERWDGSGYPDGLAGEQIPLAARIVALADAVEAMTAARPYRDALDVDDVLGELSRGRGSQWDPTIVDLVAHALELAAGGDDRATAILPDDLVDRARRRPHATAER
ncbi:MAG: response regulator [Thermoleophilia bacterium]